LAAVAAPPIAPRLTVGVAAKAGRDPEIVNDGVDAKPVGCHLIITVPPAARGEIRSPVAGSIK